MPGNSKKQFLNWGFLSTARINKALLHPLHLSKHNRLLGIASRSLQKARRAAAEMDIPVAYGSYEEMLEDPRIDVVYNPLPNSLHAEWTIKAAQAGKHVLCEKPLAISVEEVEAIERAAKEAGVIVTEAFMYLHHTQTLKVKELVEAGKIGRLQLVRGSFSFNLNNPEDVRWDLSLGGGSIWDIGCYPISFARFLFGSEPVEVFGWAKETSSGVDELFVGQLSFGEARFAQFDSSFHTHPRTGIEVVGEQASISIPEPFKPGYRSTITLTRGSVQEKILIRGNELYRGEVEDLASSVLHQQPSRLSLSFSKGNVAAIIALLKSARNGKPQLIGGVEQQAQDAR